MKRPGRMLASCLAHLGLTIDPAPAAHDSLNVGGGAGASYRQ